MQQKVVLIILGESLTTFSYVNSALNGACKIWLVTNLFRVLQLSARL